MTSEKASKVIWTIDSTHPQIALDLREALNEVTDPELGLSVVQLGLIREVVINGGTAEVTMILTTPFCPYGPSLLEMTREKTQLSLKIPTSIEMGIEMWDFSMMEEDAGADWKLY